MGGSLRRKLPTGTQPTEDRGLTNSVEVFKVKEICHIIKVCREAGVAELKFGSLEVKFGGAFFPPEKTESALLGFSEKKAYQNQTLPQEHVLPESSTLSQRFSPIDKRLLEDLERSQLMLDDPLAYEQMIIDEHISGNVGADDSRELGVETQ